MNFSFPDALNKINNNNNNMTQVIVSIAALKSDRYNIPLRSYHGTIN